ncbi:hypothetical protein EFK50_12595 [Nocardioides marmoriginsengisoli]|uniref:SGNH hydrolase-type esterase domain-containing protein n=1 Tax=Nocardioides marmoriginsengisoli TaxID=661483 RepID=A0A3N0CGN3_9ACTN|nr:GDSL-type esterase/lipase family protein [Nocardioides marmoriginsengisoli]RNL62595.1 hypothetical protein EFK50_12595 [Nocardioides marmoriginsengisoli]
MTSAMIEKLVRFQDPERTLGYARGLDDTTRAAIFGTDPATYLQVVASLEEQRREAAAQLAADPAVRLHLDRLPFERGQRIVAIGESTTADRLSWFEILSTLVAAERPDLELSLVNAAVSGATTTQTLAGLPALRRVQGDWTFCMLGSNDLQRFDGADGPRLVRNEETVRNLTELRRRQPSGGTTWVWVTPTRVDEAAVARFPFFGAAGISWSNADVDDLAASIGGLGDLRIDTAAVTYGPGAFIEDGVHPSVETQKRLVVAVLAGIAADEG